MKMIGVLRCALPRHRLPPSLPDQSALFTRRALHLAAGQAVRRHLLSTAHRQPIMRHNTSRLQALCLSLLLLAVSPLTAAWSDSLSNPVEYDPEPAAAVAAAAVLPRQTLHLRRQEGGGILSNGTAAGDNSTLARAADVVAAAQEESRARNARLLGAPRTNKNAFQVVAPSRAVDPDTGTAVDTTVAQAAAVVAEAMAQNGSIAARGLGARQASSWWMAQMTQNGRSPYVADSGYKVRFFRAASFGC
jgi:hypothetical protein